MGCNIHAYAEVTWDKRGEAKYLAHIGFNRNYGLFALMANVRNNGDFSPVVEPKGLPSGLSWQVEDERKDWEGDGYSHSWLSFEELEEVQRRYVAREGVESTELDAVIGLMRAFKKHNHAEPRLVFWFDN